MGRLRNPDPALRFNERIIKDESGCWLWQGKLNVNRYAVFKINARTVHMHRWAYETYKEPIGVSISKREKCTLSKIGDRADVLMWLAKRIEEKSFEVRKVSALMQSSLVSIVLRMLI